MTNRFEPPRARPRCRAQHRLSQRQRILRLAVHQRVLDQCRRPPPRGVQEEALRLQSAADVHHDEVAKVGPQMVTLRSRDNGRSWDRDSLQLLYDLAGAAGGDLRRPAAGLFRRAASGFHRSRTCWSRPARRRTISARTAAPGSACRPTAGAAGASRSSRRLPACRRCPGHASSMVRARRRQPDLHDRGQPGRLEAAAGRLCQRRRRRVLDLPVRDDAERRRRRGRQRPRRRPAVRRASLFLSARHHAARRPHHRVGALPARPDQHAVDRDLRERRRRPHLGLPVARQRLGRAGRPRADARRPYRLRLRLSPAAVRHARAPERGRRQDLGPRDRSCATTAAAGTSAIRA